MSTSKAMSGLMQVSFSRTSYRGAACRQGLRVAERGDRTMTYGRRRMPASSSGNRVHDNRPRSRSGRPDDERSKILFDPSERASVGLLRLLDGVEDAYGRNRVVWRIDHVISHEAGDAADNRNSALDPLREFVRLSRLRFHLANCSIHD